VVKPANIPEVRQKNEAPKVFAERMAKEKARAVWDGTRDEYVLGDDTIVVVDDLVLGKPEDEQDAERMLRLLSNRKHQVITGVCLKGSDFEDVRSETTSVHFSAISNDDIRGYIATGEPMDKAGAYAIQGMASHWISKIEGDYSNVVGLPVALVLEMLREH
jgi:septum formation protein